jgi:hypothetical protein
MASTMASSSADVTATIRRNAATVKLQNGQEVTVNGVALSGPATSGLYSNSVPRAAVYVIRVAEPTLGSNETQVPAPPDFAITAPSGGQAVSLAGGFTLSWSNPSPNVTYQLTLSQTLDTAATEVLGSFPDNTGSLEITAENLMKFRQGADITIQLTKVAQNSDVAGFASGTARVELSQTINVVPAP